MQISENATNFLERNMTAGRAVPGQSLTNSPETPHRWEQPPEFSEPHKAMLQIFETITEKESLANILLSLSKKVSVVDLSSIILYSGFIEGKWNPDLMTLLMEPTMYMIMALAEKANIKYVVDTGDDDKEPEITGEQQEKTFKRGLTALEEIKNQTVNRINPQTIPVEVREQIEQIELPKGLLEKQDQPNSLLSKEDK